MLTSKRSLGSNVPYHPQLPGPVLELVGAELLAQNMEDTLRGPARDEAEIQLERRHVKAGTYTLAAKYKISLEGFTKR